MERKRPIQTLVDVAKVAIPFGVLMCGTVFAFTPGSRNKKLERDNYRWQVNPIRVVEKTITTEVFYVVNGKEDQGN